jgi:biopolymer transport protein ExbD
MSRFDASDNNDDGVVTGINVTPMVDVMLVLLIIFVVTTQFVSESGLKINLPKTATAEVTPTASLMVSLNQQGALFLMEEPVDLDGLKANLEREVGLNPGVRVTIAADGQVSYDQVIGVLDAVKQSGITKVALASRRIAGTP